MAKRCRKGFRRCSSTKTCVSTKKSRLSTTKRCRIGTRNVQTKDVIVKPNMQDINLNYTEIEDKYLIKLYYNNK